MKTLVEFLNKTYDQKLENHKEYKKTLKEMKNFLTENKVTCSKSDDIDCIHYEIYVSSIKNKQHFEEVFFDTYVKMYDYWYDLTYKERKQQMNVDIDACKQDMKHFMYEEEEIFMPCFDSRMNHLYNTEIVLSVILKRKSKMIFMAYCHMKMVLQVHRYMPRWEIALWCISQWFIVSIVFYMAIMPAACPLILKCRI